MKPATRALEVKEYYRQSMQRVASTPAPKNQKFPNGSRVRIADDLVPYMSHFNSGVNATVVHTYAHAFGGSNVESYCLDIDGYGEVSWYEEHQLTAI